MRLARQSFGATTDPAILVSGANIIAVQISGTFVGTIAFTSTVDGTNFIATGAFPISESGTAATTATAAGIWRIKGAGLTQVKIACSAYTSGTINVDVQYNDEQGI